MRQPQRSTLFPYTPLFRSDTAVTCDYVGQTDDFRCCAQEDGRCGWDGGCCGWLRCGDDGFCTGSPPDRKSTRLNSSHANTSYSVFSLTKKILISLLLIDPT